MVAVALDGLQVGHHACGVVCTDAEREEAAVEFVGAGLSRGERVAYYADRSSPDRVATVLRDAGLDVERALADGQLTIRSAGETYLAQGRFDPEHMVAAMHEAVDAALADGYPAFRVAGEMDWGAGATPGAERLEEYERRVAEVFETKPASALCQYDARWFRGSRLDALKDAHHCAARMPRSSEDGGLLVTRLAEAADGSVWLRVSGEADVTTSELLVEALEDAVGDGVDVHLDLGRLRFLDLSALRAIEARARTLRSSGRRVVIHHPPLVLQRIVAFVDPAVEVTA